MPSAGRLSRACFRDLRAMPEDDRTNEEKVKMQQLIKYASVATEHNLAPYFTAWGFPVDTATEAAIQSFPEFEWTIGAR
jgi:hypothetical protein